MRAKKYLRYVVPTSLFRTKRTKSILHNNPTLPAQREEADTIHICVHDYNAHTLQDIELLTIEETLAFKNNQHITWINIDGLRKKELHQVCEYYGIHPLIEEDILSINQRPKMDEVEGILYCLLNMLYFNEDEKTVEQEQVSIVLGHDFVLTFQEDPKRDVFNLIRERLKLQNSKLRLRGADYLCYSMLDQIVDNYFTVMEKLGDQIEDLEEDVIKNNNARALATISHFRKELIVLKRNITPVRDLIGNLMRSESNLIDKRTIKYFKDVYDHIIQAYDLSENYRDVVLNMHDLYLNNVNLKMNEAMKVMAVVTCLMAPATVIGGVFGMNFDIIPTVHNQWGFYTAVSAMLLIPIAMLLLFKRRGWF
jgi:magnesium transporter